MSVIALDFYEPDGTTLIGTLDDADLLDLELRPALMELGAISFVISRHDASSALLTKRNLIKVRIPSVDVEPICMFVVKDDEAELVSKDEQGGEHLTYTGPGGLHMLSYGRLDEVFYAPGQTRRGNQEIAGEWAWHDVAYGGILARIMEEGIYSPGGPLAAISIDFSRTHDSAGNPWYVIAEDFSVPTGTDILTTATRLAQGGDLIMILTPDMILHCYQSVSDFARDLTGAFASDNVRIEKGVNLLTELSRKAKTDRVTHLITRDMDQVFRTFVTPDSFDQAVYGFQDIGWTNDPDQVEKTANETIRASDFYQEEFRVEVTPGFAPADGRYMPGPDGTNGHFWLGDQITLHTGSGEHDLNAAAVRVTGMVVALDEAADDATSDKAARSLRIVPELSFGLPSPAFNNVGSGAAGAGAGCPCLKLCTPLSAPLPFLVDTGQVGTGSAVITVPPGLANSKLVVIGAWDDNLPYTATLDGTPMTAITGSQIDHVSADGAMSGFYMDNPTTGTLIVNDTLLGGTFKRWYLFRDAAPGQPLVATAQSSGTTSALTLLGVGGWCNAAFTASFSGGSAATNPTPVAGQTETLANSFGAFVEFGSGYGDSTPGWVFGVSRPWVALGLTVVGSAASSRGDAHADLIGTSVHAKRCDDTEHFWRSGEPTVNDDSSIGLRRGTLWIDIDTGKGWILTDATEGAAVWLELATGLTEAEIQALIDASIADHLADDPHPTTAGALTTRYEPHVDYDGHVVINGVGDPVMVEVTN